MLTFCANAHAAPGGYENGLRPRLMFICKAEGREAATPRVMHKHDDRFELLFVMQGSGRYNVDGRDYAVRQGDILLFNAGILHDEHPYPSDDLLIFSCGVERLKIEGLPLNTLTQRGYPALMPGGEQYEEIRHIFYQMWDYASSKKRYAGKMANSLLSLLLLICRERWMENPQTGESPTPVLGQKIKDFIDEHYKDARSFTKMTSALAMNRFYLAHVFKDFSGYSPKQYQTRRRIGEAQSLLLSTALGVTEVANAVGYDNVNNFHRIFHNLVGIPPARYKKFWLTGQIRS